MRPHGPVVAAALTVLALLAGCAPGTSVTEEPTNDERIAVDTAALRAAKAKAGIEPCPAPTEEGRSDLPDLTLPCLGGGRAVDLDSIAGPAVVSLWAQWCPPCRKELPYFQRLASTGKVTVLGLNWKENSPSAALALLDVTGATFPQVVDLDGKISDYYRVSGLPGILFVTAEGAVRFRKGSVSSYAELSALVTDQTGVDLTGG